MIICRTPLRISLFGGGTDFKEWFENNGGMAISMAINQYCYSTLRNLPNIHPFKYRLRYFKNEFTKNISGIKHKSIRAVLKEFAEKKDCLEIIHSADLPALSGMGSSSAFTVSLINLIYANYNKIISKRDLAKKAVFIEKDVLKENVGYQDQYATAFGGFNIINFNKNKINVDPVSTSSMSTKNLLDNMVLYYSGYQRQADKIEKQKIKKMKKNLDYFKNIQELSLEAKKAIFSKKNNIIQELSDLMNESWKMKKKLSGLVSNNKINDLIDYGLRNGASGAKLLGAGGGGFILYLTLNKNDKIKLIKRLSAFKIVNFTVDNQGSQIIYRS